MRPVHINCRQRQRGSVLVEFALILPLLTFLLMGIFYFSMLLREHQILQNAAREGARFSSLKQNSGSVTAVQAVVTNYLAQENITVSASDVSVNQSYSFSVVDPNGNTVWIDATRISVTYSRSLPLGTALFGPVDLTGQAVFPNLY